MFKQKMVLEVKAGDDRVHSYVCEPESPLGEVYDAMSAMRAHVLEKMQEQAKEKKECCEKSQEEKPSSDEVS